MWKISKVVLVIRFFVKVAILKVIGAGIKTRGLALMGRNAEISSEGGAIIELGHKTWIDSCSYVAARKGGELIMGKGVYINRFCSIVARKSITIGDGCMIGPHCCIIDHDHDLYDHSSFNTSPIIIGNNVWLGGATYVLRGVKIGDNAVIAAGSIITHDIPANSIVIQKRNTTFKEI